MSQENSQTETQADDGSNNKSLSASKENSMTAPTTSQTETHAEELDDNLLAMMEEEETTANESQVDMFSQEQEKKSKDSK